MAKSSLRGYNKNNAENSNSTNNEDDTNSQANDRLRSFTGADFDEGKFDELKKDEPPIEGVDGAREFLSQNENKSEDELMGDLKNMISSGKEDGSFSKEMLENFYNMAAPMMQGQQREKLDDLVNMIKNDQL